MLRRKAFKFRLKTNSEIENCLVRFAGSVRFVWNRALASQKDRLDSKENILSYNELAGLLVKWKEEEDTKWLSESPSQPLQQTLKNLDKALRDAFNKKSPKRFPRFKKKGHHDGFRYPQGIKLEDNRVFLPKIGWVGFFKSREVQGTVKNATVSRRGRDWFVSVQTEQEVEIEPHPSKSIVGVDVGITRFATASDGTVYRPINSFKKLSTKLAREQRSLRRKIKGSNNSKRQKQKISRIHSKIADVRLDYLHKTSTTLSKNHACVVLEDLKVSNMSRSAKGTLEKPGKNVKAKSGLNRSMLDQGWHTFRMLLRYKLEWSGGELVLVNPKYTSQTCSKCGHASSENRTTQARFCCTACGHAENADLQAARNILAAGHAVLACGDTELIAA